MQELSEKQNIEIKKPDFTIEDDGFDFDPVILKPVKIESQPSPIKQKPIKN
jgi:hypothetical protein